MLNRSAFSINGLLLSAVLYHRLSLRTAICADTSACRQIINPINDYRHKALTTTFITTALMVLPPVSVTCNLEIGGQYSLIQNTTQTVCSYLPGYSGLGLSHYRQFHRLGHIRVQLDIHLILTQLTNHTNRQAHFGFTHFNTGSGNGAGNITGTDRAE